MVPARHIFAQECDLCSCAAPVTVTHGHSLQEFEAAREDIKNKNTEDLNVMKITLESTIDELEKKFEISHEAYLMQACCCTAAHQTRFLAVYHVAMPEFARVWRSGVSVSLFREVFLCFFLHIHCEAQLPVPSRPL